MKLFPGIPPSPTSKKSPRSALFAALAVPLFLVLLETSTAQPLQNGAEPADDAATAYWKRAGFVGMRGKKSEWRDDDDPIMSDKRAGFQGMRGKKWDGGEDDNEANLYDQYLKRAGFVGMRGKKMAEDDEDGFALSKRDGFVGMRGKKWGFWTPRSAATQNGNGDSYVMSKMRRAGFVGMRG